MSTTQAARDPWLDQVRLSPTQWFELVTRRKLEPFPVQPDMPTCYVLTRKDSPMPAGIDVDDPVCPDCQQYPMQHHETMQGLNLLWCGGCGLLAQVQHLGAGKPAAVEVFRPTARVNEHHGKMM